MKARSDFAPKKQIQADKKHARQQKCDKKQGVCGKVQADLCRMLHEKQYRLIFYTHAYLKQPKQTGDMANNLCDFVQAANVGNCLGKKGVGISTAVWYINQLGRKVGITFVFSRLYFCKE